MILLKISDVKLKHLISIPSPMKRHFMILLVLLATIHGEGQNVNSAGPVNEETITLNCIGFIKTRTLDYNKDLCPVPYTDISMLLDSLWKQNTSFWISHFAFSEQDLVIKNNSPNLGQFITNDRWSPFLRYKLDKFPNGKYMLTILQGHL